MNPRQIKDFDRQIVNLMTEKAEEIDPYLKVQCFQINSQSSLMSLREGRVDSLPVHERGSILHYLSASGHFPGILDFILRKKCLTPQILDKNELSTEIHEGQEYHGNSALHLACMSLRQKSIEKLLLSRIDANIQSGRLGDTPLHTLIKMHEWQALALDGQNEDIGADVDLEDIQDCMQLILPFCEGSLTISNHSGQTAIDLLAQSTSSSSHLLRDLINDHYQGAISADLDAAKE